MAESNACVFCEIVAGTIPAQTVYEDELCIAFRDLNPQAPTHLLLIPREHVQRLDELTEAKRPLAGHLLERTSHIAREQGLSEDGFRTVINCGPKAGQEVYHLHIHILGGRALQWPPG